MLTSQIGVAQFESTKGRFQVDFIEGCSSLEVIITPKIPCPCNIYFNGGSGNPVDDNIASGELTHSVTYSEPGVYDLIVVHENLDRDSIQITVHVAQLGQLDWHYRIGADGAGGARRCGFWLRPPASPQLPPAILEGLQPSNSPFQVLDRKNLSYS